MKTENSGTDSDTQPEFNALPALVPSWVLFAASYTSILIALVSFVPAGVFCWGRQGRGSTEAAVSVTALGCMFLFVGIAGRRIATKEMRRTDFSISGYPLKSSPFLRVTAFVVALPVLFGGGVFLWEGALLFNQEYFQGGSFNVLQLFGDNPASVDMWKNVIGGECSILVGMFLCWFAFFKGGCRSSLLTQYHALEIKQPSQASED